MLSFQINPGSGFFVACSVMLNILTSSTGQTNPSPSISTSVAGYICGQQSAFQESGQIQTPLKAKPDNDDSVCGWYQWKKCELAKSESCPSFVHEACTETQVTNTGKKGKGISQKQNQWKKAEDEECENSTKLGLPNPQIVLSASKYPSLVTIKAGDRCKDKLCTGLILDKNWVIVMNSGCMYKWLDNKHPDFIEIVAGEMKLFAEDGTEQRRKVKQNVPHPGHKPREQHYYKDNIGLVRVTTPFEFNVNVQPINWTAIETIASSIPKSILTIAGYTLAQPEKEEEILQSSLIESSPLDYFPMDKCYDEKMEGDGAPKETLICAGQCPFGGDEKTQPFRNVLYGQLDSNSPPVPIGLGPQTHRTSSPSHGVFVNLASYRPWIQEQMKGQGQSAESNSESRIVRGEDAPPHKYKSIVNVEELGSYACSRQFCGGTILSEEWFVTAAHCVTGDDPATLRAIVGDHDISDSNKDEQVVSAVKIVVHKDYNGTTSVNDIAVVKVSPPFKFNDKVQKVTLPDPSFYPDRCMLTAAGWGLDEKIQGPYILQQLELPVVSVKDCQTNWEGAPVPSVITEKQICAGNETHGICKGDSGGPLYHIDESGAQILVGAVSLFGTACVPSDAWEFDPYSAPDPDKKFRPAVFTRVTSYLEWIRKNAEMK